MSFAFLDVTASLAAKDREPIIILNLAQIIGYIAGTLIGTLVFLSFSHNFLLSMSISRSITTYVNLRNFPRLIYLALVRLDGSKSLEQSGLLGDLGVGVEEEDIKDYSGVCSGLILVLRQKNSHHFYIFL